jgi:excisionase family DNA binding protein
LEGIDFGCDKGKIPALKIASQWRFKKEDISRWVEKQRKN